MTIPPAEPLPIALRAYAPPPARQSALLEPSDYALIFDCETVRGTAHALRFGAFQVRQAGQLIRAGFFYDAAAMGDDLALLSEYADEHDLELITRGEFVEQVFFRYAQELGGLCIGFNLPFDLGRLAIGHVTGRGAYSNAFSLEVSEDKGRDRVRVQHRSANAARIEFVPRHARRASDHRGHVVDVKTLARALTASSHSLASLSEHLKTPTRKQETNEHGGPLTREYIAYAADDPQVTWECYEILAARYASYALERTPITQVMSEASIGKGSLREMGVLPFRQVQPNFPPELTGQIMSTYSGGRSEVRLRKQVAEVAHCDFKSMYTSVCALMGLWRFVIADGVDHEDATEETRMRLETLELADLQRPEAWEDLQVIVEVRPDADFFPVRCRYGAAEQYGLAQSYLSSTTGETFWFTLADCYASKLRTGKEPEVVSAIRFVPRKPQPGLETFAIAGNPEYRVDPYEDDFYVRLIELRSEVKCAAKLAERDGDQVSADSLEAEQLALKITASATSYGIFIELNPQELDKLGETAVFGLDGERFDATVRRYEKPGRYFHPLLATLVTGGARLMLSVAELLSEREGLDWAFCDTDSLVLVRPEAMEREAFHAAVDRVRDWFNPLSPYANEPDLLELEKTNYRLSAGEVTKEREPLYCYAISPKRYALFNINASNAPIIRKGSAHGLGHLMAPYEEKDAPGDIPEPALPLHKLELKRWQYDLWYRIVQAALNDREVDLDSLPGFERVAMASCSVTRPTIEKWFHAHNRERPYCDRTRPFSFLITPTVRAFDKPLGKASQPFHLVAPYEKNAASWLELEYVDIYSNEAFRASTDAINEYTARVQTYRDHAARYINHPDPKRLGPDGKPCGRHTTGLLSPRHIDAFHIEQIGKEANRLEEVEAGLTHDRDEVYTQYKDPRRDIWQTLVLPVLAAMPRTNLLASGSLQESALREVCSGRAHPHPSARARLQTLAVRCARTRLEELGLDAPRHHLAVLHAYHQAQSRHQHPPKCEVCKTLLLTPRATYCSPACKQAAYRNRRPNSQQPPPQAG